GVQAQTVANALLAEESKLKVIPIVNKIDLPTARPVEVMAEMENILAIDSEEVIKVSAKSGLNADKVLEAIVKHIPPPEGDPEQPLQGLIFDSVYNDYRGVIIYLRVVNGSLKRDDEVVMMNTKRVFKVEEVGKFNPRMFSTKKLEAGEVGYVVGGIKNIRDIKIGDTLTLADRPTKKALPGYHEPLPMVYCGFYPTRDTDFKEVKKSIERLSLNDSSFSFEPENSEALGFGFRCGFLGLLHMDIVQERLEREYDLDLIITAPSVSYVVRKKGGEEEMISSPVQMPDGSTIEAVSEPWIKMEIVCPKDTVGGIMKIVQQRRGIYKNMNYIDEERVLTLFEMPLANVIIDFYDNLKNVSSGYASMNYEFIEFREENLIKLDIMIAGERIDSLAVICHRTESESLGRRLSKKLKEVIPRAQFAIAIQAAIGGKIVARETISAFRKDVTSGLYGGDVTRKNKLLKKQKKGKKRMKQMGNISLPQDAFQAILKKD
ncbi:translation elongation factor 4, partial [Candidatus Pacearchaeota archaeon]|nr:translation elongation factor 4 [Candidatus Pacearchaeota archaeon]